MSRLAKQQQQQHVVSVRVACLGWRQEMTLADDDLRRVLNLVREHDAPASMPAASVHMNEGTDGSNM
jgi:hypothetical protein